MNQSKITIHNLNKNDIGKDEKLADIFTNIMCDTWGDPGDSVKEWLPTADIVSIAISGGGGVIVGFAACNFIDKNILYLHATVVHKDFSGLGLYRKLNKKVISRFVIKHFYSSLKGFWCVFRTSNPSLYERVYKLFPLFPDYKNDRTPTGDEQKIIKKVCSLVSPESDVDFETFVVRRAYKDWQGLIRKTEEIPYAYNSEINDFFESKLHLSEMDGSAMMFLGKINLLMIAADYIKSKKGNTHS